jgi:hypothetical protein
VISVPLTVLRDGDIHFIPELPKEKQLAAKKVGMGPAMKVREQTIFSFVHVFLFLFDSLFNLFSFSFLIEFR